MLDRFSGDKLCPIPEHELGKSHEFGMLAAAPGISNKRKRPIAWRTEACEEAPALKE